jgi:hypothetical protein
MPPAGFNLPERGSLVLAEFRATIAIEVEITPTIIVG